MLRFVILFAIAVGLCAASDSPTVPPHLQSSYGSRNTYGHDQGRGNSHGGYGGYGYAPWVNSFDYRNLENQLERVDTYLDNLETREANQVYRLNRLAQSANLNLDFRNNFENTISEEIAFHQEQQNKRCDAIDQAIAQIRLIRQRVLNLTVDAEAIRTNLDEEVFPVNKEIASDIRHLQHEDILSNNRISETQGRADAVNAGIDVLIAKAWENTRFIYVLFRDIKAGIKSVNRERSVSNSETLFPNGDPASTTFDFVPPFDGSPQFAQSVIGGFHLIRDHYHTYGYPSIYFGIASDLWNTKVNIDSLDMSTGGWVADSVDVFGSYIYFDSNELVLQSKEIDWVR